MAHPATRLLLSASLLLGLTLTMACGHPDAAPAAPRPVSLKLQGRHGLLLAEAVTAFTREEVLASKGEAKGWRDTLLKAGYRDDELVDGSEVLVRTQFYANNAGGRMQETTYLVHRPPGLELEILQAGGARAGDLVEVEITPGDPGRAGIGLIARVRDRRTGPLEPGAPVRPWLRHRYAMAAKYGFEKAMDAINPSGGGQSSCITGEGLVQEGWVCFYGGFLGGGAYQWWKPLEK